MGFLGLFGKAKKEVKMVEKLPSGSFTISPKGDINASTLPGSFPEEIVKEIGQVFLRVFKEAQDLNMPFKEFQIDYAGLKMIGRDAKGGAIVFLTPRKFK